MAKKLNLNECLIMKMAYNKSSLATAMRRAVRPFLNPINKAVKDAAPEYEKMLKEIKSNKDNKDLSNEEIFKIFDRKATEYNNKVLVDIDFSRNSSKAFIYQVWSPFQWDPKEVGEATIDLIDAIDEKLVEIYPEINIDLEAMDPIDETQEPSTEAAFEASVDSKK